MSEKRSEKRPEKRSERAPVGVILVEDDPLTREAWVKKINQDPGLVVAEACANLEEGRAAVASTDAKVALIDLGLPDGDGTELIRLAVARVPPIEVMVMTVFGDERHVIRAIEAGATGYLLKDDPVERVAQAVLSLVHGGSPMSPGIARHVLNRLRGAAPVDATGAGLTERELTVLNALSRGFTYGEVAEQLGLSNHTVGTHVKHIYRKLEVCSRSEAVYEAAQLGLIRLA